MEAAIASPTRPTLAAPLYSRKMPAVIRVAAVTHSPMDSVASRLTMIFPPSSVPRWTSEALPCGATLTSAQEQADAPSGDTSGIWACAEAAFPRLLQTAMASPATPLCTVFLLVSSRLKHIPHSGLECNACTIEMNGDSWFTLMTALASA